MKKTLKYLGIAVGTLALFSGIFLYATQTHAAGGPTVTFNPSWGPYGINGGSLTISHGPYTQDFRVTMCLIPTLPGAQNGTPAPTSDPVPLGEPSNAQCATTAWASSLGWAGIQATQWVGQAQDDPFWCNGVSCAPYITVETQPLPTGMNLEDMTLGIEFADDNSSPPSPSYNCDEWTPIFGGTSGVAYGFTYGDCYNYGNLSQKPNYFRLFMNGYDLTFNSAAGANNIPTTFNTSQNKTLGTNNQPLQISVLNTSNFAWGEDQATTITGSEVGTCDDINPWYACPDPSRPVGTACTVGINNWSSDFSLKHVGGSFAVGTDPVPLSTGTSTITCTVGPIGCDNNGTDDYTGVACNHDQATCENTQSYCIAYDPNDATICTQMSTPCASTWEPQLSLVAAGAPSYNYISPGQTETFDLGSLTAPSTPGTYTEVWQMNSKGNNLSGDDYPYTGTFGNQIPITITVAASSSTTPVASCLPTSIAVGGSTSCTLTLGGVNQSSTWTVTGTAGGTISPTGVYTPTNNGTETITGTTPSGPSGSTTVTVSPAGPGGTITVTSVNATDNSIAVPASWDLSGNVTSSFVCSALGNLLWQGSPCTGSSQAYSGLPDNNDAYVLSGVTTTDQQYSLNTIEQTPIAEKNAPDIMTSLGLSLNNILSTPAEAFVIPQGFSQTLSPSSSSAAFTILWTPNADMQVSTTSTSLDPSTSPTQTVTLTNTGAPGSTLIWSATTSTSNGGNWLIVSPSGGTVTNGATSGATGSATISFDSSVESSLPNGTYTGTVQVQGFQQDGFTPVGPATNVSVTLIVGGGGSSYFACGAGTCTTTATPGATSCATACGLPGGTTPIVTCTPSAVTVGGSTDCSVTLGGVTQSSTWGNTGTAGGTIDPTGVYTPTGNGSETINGTLPDGTTGNTTITVTGGGGGGYFACGAGVCMATTTAGATSCATACGLPGGTTPIVTCSPSSVTLGGTTQCYVDLGGVNQSSTWTTTGTAGGSIGPTGIYSPGSNGSETIDGTLPDGTSGGTTVTVTSLPSCGGAPSCQAVCSPTLSASPSSIVIPESSNLSYSCSNVTQCQLSGGQFGGGISEPASTTISVDPSMTTSYTLNCVNGAYTDSSASSSATVTVNGSNRCEQNPNGAGCPGQ